LVYISQIVCIRDPKIVYNFIMSFTCILFLEISIYDSSMILFLCSRQEKRQRKNTETQTETNIRTRHRVVILMIQMNDFIW